MLSGILGGVGGGVTQSLSIYLYSYYWGLTPRAFGILIPLGSAQRSGFWPCSWRRLWLGGSANSRR